MDSTTKINNATFTISVPSEYMYDGKYEVSVILQIDYKNKIYQISTPEIVIETYCNKPLLIADAIKKAHNVAIGELYPDEQTP